MVVLHCRQVISAKQYSNNTDGIDQLCFVVEYSTVKGAQFFSTEFVWSHTIHSVLGSFNNTSIFFPSSCASCKSVD